MSDSPITDPSDPDFVYEEFGLFEENIAEFDLSADPSPVVERIETGR